MRNSSTWCPGTSSHGRGQPKVLWCSCYDGFPWQRVRYMYRSSLMAIKINYVYVTCWVNIRSSHESKGPFRNFGCSDKDVQKIAIEATGPRSHGILLCHLWMMWLWEVALWKLLRFWLPILPSPASFPAVAVGEVGVIHPITSGMIAVSWKLMLSSRFSECKKRKICSYPWYLNLYFYIVTVWYYVFDFNRYIQPHWTHWTPALFLVGFFTGRSVLVSGMNCGPMGLRPVMSHPKLNHEGFSAISSLRVANVWPWERPTCRSDMYREASQALHDFQMSFFLNSLGIQSPSENWMPIGMIEYWLIFVLRN